VQDRDPLRIPIEGALDLHAFLPPDIPSVVDEYVREAQAAGLREVRLVHGRGRGVQRGIVQQALERHPLVVEFSTIRVAPERNVAILKTDDRGSRFCSTFPFAVARQWDARLFSRNDGALNPPPTSNWNLEQESEQPAPAAWRVANSRACAYSGDRAVRGDAGSLKKQRHLPTPLAQSQSVEPSPRSSRLLVPFDRPVAPIPLPGFAPSPSTLDAPLARSSPSNACTASCGATQRAAINILPFQLEPALALIHGRASRFLLADEVGLARRFRRD
jgi:hypothetical protein